MKKIVGLMMFAILFTACVPADLLPTEPIGNDPVEPTVVVTSPPNEPIPPTITPEPTPPGSEAAVEAAIQFLAQQLGIDPKEVLVISVVTTTWPNSCLGIPAKEEMCMDVITPGFAIQLMANGEYFTVHTDETGRSVRVLPAALQEARLALIELTGLPLSQIRLVSFEVVEWRDSCLGVVTPGIGCLTVITPGYIVIFDANGGIYEYHTNQDGSQLILASGPVSPSPGVLLNWSSMDEPCVTVQTSAGQVEYGPCGGALTPASFYAWPRQQDLTSFVGLYAPVETQTQAGTIALRGSGRVVATPAEQRMLAEWGHLVYDEAVGEHGGAAWGLVYSWHREGGIAGFCDDIGVYLSGEALVSSCATSVSRPPARMRLNSLQMAQLYMMVHSLVAFDLNQTDPATADAMTIILSFSGEGTAEATPEDQQYLLDMASNLVNQAMTPENPGGQTLALQVLEDYLTALAVADYAGADARYGGSYETFIANNPEINPQDHAALFEAACTINGFVCNLSVRSVVNMAALTEGLFTFTVELQNPEGALFELGPCCGESPIDSPPQTQFAFMVALVEGSYLVMTSPVYIP